VGLWPDEDRCEILDWQLGENEEAEAWIAFLGSLEEQGIRGSNGRAGRLALSARALKA
jgi:transposase-like protein